MKKSSSRAAIATDAISVAVVSFGNDPIPLTLKKGATVSDALSKAGLSQGKGQLFVSGETADLGDELEDKDVLSIVTSKQAGA